MGFTYEVIVSVHRAMMLPQRIASERMVVRVNGVIETNDPEGRPAHRRQETEPGAWNSGTRSRDVSWTGGKRSRRMGAVDSGAARGIAEGNNGAHGVLSWRLSEEELKHLKAYRPKIKIYCYATVAKEGASALTLADSEPLGWMTLDLRDFQAQRLTDVSYALRGVKGDVTPIRVVLSARLTCNAEPIPALAPGAPPAVAAASDHAEVAVLPSALAPDLDALPIGEGRNKFEVEVTLERAGRLLGLAPELENMGLPFWFSYELFGMVLQTGRFESLANPVGFNCTTDTFRVAGSVAELAACLATPVGVYLCSNQLVLASTHLPFEALELDSRSPHGSLTQSHTADLLLNPARLGVEAGGASGAFLRVRIDVRSEGPVDDNGDTAAGACADLSAFLDQTVTPDLPSPAFSTVPPAPERGHDADGPVVAGGDGIEAENGPPRDASNDHQHHQNGPVNESKAPAPSSSESFAVGLSSADVAVPSHVSTSDSAPARSSSAASSSDPAPSSVHVPSDSVPQEPVDYLPEPYSTLEPQPQTTEQPLDDANSTLLPVPPSVASHLPPFPDANQRPPQFTPDLPVSAPPPSPVPPSHEPPHSSSSAEPLTHPGATPQAGMQQPRAPRTTMAQQQPTAQYTVVQQQEVPQATSAQQAATVQAMAYEMAEAMAESKVARLKAGWKAEWLDWQRSEEAAWAERLRSREAARAAELEEAFRGRESERQAAVARSQAEYSKVEAKLRATLGEVEARERRLQTAEEGLKQTHASKLSELQLLQRRVREEAKHQVEMERQRREVVERQLKQAEEALERGRMRTAEVEEDFEKFRRATRKVPEVNLRAELAQVMGEKAEAEARVEKERSAKQAALLEKETFRAHVHQLARALKREQDKATASARQEAEALRLEYLGKEERFVLDGDRAALKTIKEELDLLRGHAKAPHPSQQQQQQVHSSDATHVVGEASSSVQSMPVRGEDDAARLRREKEELLRTGQYRSGDIMIEQLNKAIAEAETRLYGD